MSKLIRRTKKNFGAALLIALQMITLTLAGLLMPLAGGPQQQRSAPPQDGFAVANNAPAVSQMSATQTQTAQAPTASAKDALRASAIPATKLSGQRATEVFNLATTRAASSSQAESANGATLTTDQEDYQPYTYVYITGAGFAPGETVNMIVVQLSPNPASYEPWDVVADANGNFQTSWYIFSEDLIGAAMQVTGTGQTSQLTASATFTDAVPPKGVAPVSPPTGGFAIEGDLLSNTPTSPSPFAANQGDWYAGTGGSGGNVLNSNAAGTPVDSTTTFHLVDLFSSATDDNFAGGDKVDDNPNTWNWTLNPVNDKQDMNNALIHVAKDPITQHTWIIIAGDRLSNNGDAYIDFEFLQNTLTTTPLVAGRGGFSSQGPDCGRTLNDFLLTLKLTNGGTVPDFFVSRWEAVSGNHSCTGPSFDYVDVTTPVITATPPAVFAAVNAGAVTVPNNTAFGSTTYPINTFTEAAVDLTALLGSFNPCLTVGIKTILVKTKESQSATANIVDLIAPQQLVPPLVIGPTVDAGPDQAKCADPSGTTSFSLTGTAQPGTYPITSTTWSCVSGCTGVTISSPSTLSTGVTIAGAPHTVTLRLTVMDSGTCANHIRSDDVILTVNQVLASSSNTPILCHGGSSTVTVSASGGATPYAGTGTFSRSAGTYSFTVTDANSCTATTTGTISEPDSLVASSTNTAILCHGGSSTVTVNATGGTTPYSGTGTFSHSAGTYSYTVTDHNGCLSTTTGTITEPSAGVLASSTNTAIPCHGGSSTVTVSATGGTTPYSGTGTFSHSAGTYSYTVTDHNGCLSTTTGTITEPDAVVASSSNTAILCHGGNSTVTVSATGGTTPYSGTGSFSVPAGTYSYTVTDHNGCLSTTTGMITEPDAVVASSSNTAILCHGGNSTVTVSATGGTAPYSGTGSFSIPAGTYSYTVTDHNGCLSTTTGNITEPSAVVADSTNTAILCHGGNSTVTVSATGGTAPYSGTGSFSVPAGSYSYTVTDHNGCLSTTTGTITEPSAVVADSTNTAILCHGGNSTVTVSATGGTAPYSGTGSFSIPAGSYSYTVTDHNGCVATTTGDISEPSAVVASSSNTAILCHGGSSTVTVSASGGTAPYQGTGTVSHAAGTYSYTVTDANSCTSTTTGTITEPSTALSASSSNTTILCNGGSSTVTVSATGGTPPYQGTGTVSRSAGTYSYTVTDANSCTATTTGGITQPPALIASSSNTRILCNGGSSIVTVSASGGTSPYQGTGTANRSAGTYSYTVTDANGCTATTTGNITQPSALSASSSNTAILCNGGSSTVTVNASGGTAPYSGTGTFSRSAGTYSYTVTDANSCTATTTGNITQPSALTLALAAGACSSSNNGSLTATFGSGTGPYQLKIDAGSFFTATSPYTFTGLAAGSHTVTVKDANGCTKSSSITVASCPRFCTLTQGAYGNAGGKYTYNGVKYTTSALLQLLTSPAYGGSLVVGVPGVGGRSLTIPLSAVLCLDGDNSCRLARLPANTTPASLPSNFGNQTLNACGTTPSCQTNPAIPLQGNAQWQSTLLGQTVTLTLNTRLDPNLPGLGLPSCVSIPASVLTALDTCGYGRTVAGLLNLANHGLAGQSTCSASLGDITNALNAINTYFNGSNNNNCPMCQQ